MNDEPGEFETFVLGFISYHLFSLDLGNAHAAGPLLIAYGGHNETMAPLWVGIEKGLFRKHGLDPRVLQTRSGPIMMATLASGGAPLVWAAPSSALSATVGGMKLGCFAVGSNKMPRELIVQEGNRLD